MPFIIHLLLGTFISFFAAMPLGPVNLAIVQTAINRGRKEAVTVAVGSSVVELIYCLLAVWGVGLLFDNKTQQDTFVIYLHMASAPLIFILGVLSLLKRVKTDEEENDETKKIRRSNSFMTGFMLNLFNPLLFPFWLLVAGYLRGNNWLSDDFSLLLLYSVGVMLGTFLLQMMVAVVASKKQEGMSYKNKVKVTRFIGWMFIVLALYVIYRMIELMIKIGWI